MIFHNDKFIGGYDKLCIYYEEYKLNKQLVETDNFQREITIFNNMIYIKKNQLYPL